MKKLCTDCALKLNAKKEGFAGFFHCEYCQGLTDLYWHSL